MIFACDATGPTTEFGHAELIYEYVSGPGLNFDLADASPDGSMYLLFGYNKLTGEDALYYLEPDVGELEVILSGSSGWYAFNAKLSPDKENVVFEFGDVFVVPITGGEPRRIYDEGVDPTATQWVDNETVLILVFEWDSPEDYGWKVKTVNVNTLEVTTLLSITRKGWPVSSVFSSYLSSDGKYLFVNGKYQEGVDFDPFFHFFHIYDTETWEYEEYILGEGGIDNFPDGPWSPDGKKIAIFDGPGTYIGYFDVETCDDVMVFHSYKLDLEWYYGLIWSVDGKRLLASEDRDDNMFRVFAIDVE
jgi:dipeptidyl aminopeptidase/acylaminoacyl peptidase